MDWLEIVSWIVIGCGLAALHVAMNKERLTHPMAIFASGVVGALIGGTFIRALQVTALSAGGYSFAALLTAAVVGELAVLLALASRAGHHPGSLDGNP